jgi:hypothetical protein
MNWRSWFGLDPTQNPYLRLSEADRYKVGKLWLWVFIGAAAALWLLGRFLRLGL